MGNHRKTTAEDLKLMDKYLGPDGKGLSREAITDMMTARGLGHDAVEIMIAMYNHGKAGRFDRVKKNRSAGELLKSHVLELFGAEKKQEEPEVIEGQITAEEILKGMTETGFPINAVTEETLKVAPERPDGYTFVPVPAKTYGQLLTVAGFLDMHTDDVLTGLIGELYKTMTERALLAMGKRSI